MKLTPLVLVVALCLTAASVRAQSHRRADRGDRRDRQSGRY